MIFWVIARSLNIIRDRINAGEWNNLTPILIDEVLPAAGFVCVLATFAAAFVDRGKLATYIRSQQHTFVSGLVIASSGSYFLVTAGMRASDFSSWLLDILAYAMAIGIAVFGMAYGVHKMTGWPFFGSAFRNATVALIVVLLAAAFVAQCQTFDPNSWQVFATINNSGIPAIACVLGVIAVILANFVVPALAAAAFLFASGARDELRRLLFQSLSYQRPVQVNLSDGKVYIGIVHSLPAQVESADGYFVLLPLCSGYRDPTKKTMHLETFYDRIYDEINREIQEEFDALVDLEVGKLVDLASKDVSREDIKVLLQRRDAEKITAIREDRHKLFYRVFPIAEVHSAGYFDFKEYLRFNAAFGRIASKSPNEEAAPPASEADVTPEADTLIAI